MGNQVLALLQFIVIVYPETSHDASLSLTVFTLLTLGCSMPQFGFLGNIFGGFLGNRGQPTGQTAPAFGSSSAGAGGGRCGGGNSPNFQFQGRNYLLSWRLGCTDFTQSQGLAFCRSNGMRAVSLDSAPRRLSSRGWWSGRVRDSSGQEAM